MARARGSVFIIGIYAADLVFSGPRIPASGETAIAAGFMRSHGGKGSNQAVAAVRAGSSARFFTLLGDDAFGQDALDFWRTEGVDSKARVIKGEATGAAGIFVDARTGHNSIYVYPGASRLMNVADVDTLAADIAASDVFVVQLEQPLEVAAQGLRIAREHGVTAILNPAPAVVLPDEVLALCDYIVPNETEASLLSGIDVDSVESAKAAAGVLLAKGARNVIITLGESGALFSNGNEVYLVPAINAGACVDTTGAGDAFIGALAAALADHRETRDALSFASVAAGISVTRHGAAASMPALAEIREFMGQGARRAQPSAL